jgi:hypothetical protein
MNGDPKIEALRGFFRIGMFIGLCGFVMIFFSRATVRNLC